MLATGHMATYKKSTRSGVNVDPHRPRSGSVRVTRSSSRASVPESSKDDSYSSGRSMTQFGVSTASHKSQGWTGRTAEASVRRS